jgi:eukaryotic-like serine/threonine-protein kinase
MTSVASPAITHAEGSVIAQKYLLEGLLGEGGMGSVWRAFNLQLETRVAIKLLRSDLNTAELGERLRVEARAAAQLVHPSIVRVFDIGEAEAGAPFIVMELLHGESLGDMLERGPLPADHALQLLLPIAEALALAHSRGVVHRDLKPDNIFIATQGVALQPKLLDFGIAKLTSAVSSGAPSLTQTGTLLGSPDYMSPEQASGLSDVDERSDVWAFCVVLYEALSGHAPFRGATCQDILQSVIYDTPAPLELRAGVDAALAELVMSGLAKQREGRPSSIFELGQQLAGWLLAQGVRDDATGTSLETKWFARYTEMHPLSAAQAASWLEAQQDDATLVSVVRPSLQRRSEPTLQLPVRSRRGWLAGAALTGCGLLAYVGWASVHQQEWSQSFARSVLSTAPIAAQLPLATPAAAPAATVQIAPVAAVQIPSVLAIEALPVEPSPASTPPRQAKSRVGTMRPAVLHAPPAMASTLPRALPIRQPRSELLNPY